MLASIIKGSLKPLTGVKVFSATMFADRARLGETVTEWLCSHPELRPLDIIVTQSSDQAFHCIAITVFYGPAEVATLVAAPAPRSGGRRLKFNSKERP